MLRRIRIRIVGAFVALLGVGLVGIILFGGGLIVGAFVGAGVAIHFLSEEGPPTRHADGTFVQDDLCPGSPVGADVDERDCSPAQALELDLAARYSPILKVDDTDYLPEPIDIILDSDCAAEMNRGGVPQGNQPVVTPVRGCATVASLADPNNGPTTFIDIKRAKPVASRGIYAVFYDEIAGRYGPVVYADVQIIAADVLIDYWLYYYYDVYGGFLDHESDWERVRVTVHLDPGASAPLKDAASWPAQRVDVGYSQHTCDSGVGTPRHNLGRFGVLQAEMPVMPLPDVATTANGSSEASTEATHPVVFVAKGSHANYFTDGGRNHWHAPGPCSLFGDSTPANHEITPAVILFDCDPNVSIDLAWARFRGFWGEKGPTSPCLHG